MSCKLCPILILTVAISLVAGRSGGPPLGSVSDDIDNLICQQLIPSPANHGAESTESHDYKLYITPALTETANGFSYTPSQVYTITIVGGDMRGFFLQARMPSNIPAADEDPMLLGSFQPATNQKTLACDPSNTEGSISHSANLADSMPDPFTWTAPSTAGEVNFFYTVVRTRMEHFDANNARTIGLGQAPPTDPPPTTQDDPATPEPPATQMPGEVTAPTRAPERYRLRFQNPPGCTRPNCDVFIGIDTNGGNNGYLDIYLEGRAQGWVAVGFSETASMFAADVVACQRVGEDVFAHDAWNRAVGRGNMIDSVQDVTLHSSTYDNGLLTCSISKKITPTDSEDLALDEDLFIIWARFDNPEASSAMLSTHSGTSLGTNARGFSSESYDASTAREIIGGSQFDLVHRPNLIRAHGILMIIAWPVLGLIGIFFSLYMKTALPNGEWFQVHRALMLASMVFGIVAFVLIFVALMGSGGLVDTSNTTSIVHMVFGILVTFVLILNPILAAFRCKPDSKYRWIYNMVHGWLLGIIAESLAITNVSLGLSIFTRTLSNTFTRNAEPLWVEVAWDVFYFVFSLGMAIAYPIARIFVKGDCDSCNKCEKTSPGDIEMKEPGEKGDIGSDKKERKKPGKLSPISWVGLVILLVVTLPAQLAVIVMVAFP